MFSIFGFFGYKVGCYLTNNRNLEQGRKEFIEISRHMQRIPKKISSCYKEETPKDLHFIVGFWFNFEKKKELRKLVEILHDNEIQVTDAQKIDGDRRKFFLWFPLEILETRSCGDEENYLSEIMKEKTSGVKKESSK